MFHPLPTDAPEPRPDAGQGMAEYALILSLIAVVAITALSAIGGSISSLLSSVGMSI